MGRPLGPRQQGYLLSLLAQPSLFLPTLLPKHLPVFCLSSVPPFRFLPVLLSMVELLQSLFSSLLKMSYLAVTSNWVLVVDAFRQSDLFMSVFAFACHWRLRSSYLVSQGTWKQNQLSLSGFYFLKSKREIVSRIFLKGVLFRSAQGTLNPPYTKHPLICKAGPSAQHGCILAVRHCKCNYLQFE